MIDGNLVGGLRGELIILGLNSGTCYYFLGCRAVTGVLQWLVSWAFQLFLYTTVECQHCSSGRVGQRG
jgi:hypothetical protein